jgi:adenosylmethionine-8-amino-7-oxononanoate aminotransferase
MTPQAFAPLMGEPCALVTDPPDSPDTAALLATDRAHLIHPLHHPVEVDQTSIYVRGRGVMLEDIDGHRYIDGLSGLWNVNLGHGRLELAEAARRQMTELAYVSGFVGSSNIPSIALADHLLALTGRRMEAVFFTSGGAEANESAFKTARFYWKAHGRSDKVKIIARDQAYHGLTLQTMSATGMGRGYWKMFEPRVPGFVHVQTCYPYRYQRARPGESVGEAAARELEEAILREGPETVAAFVGEPIHGAGGVIYPTDDYWPRVREICTRHDVLLIADEIITAFGRTGRWFALSHWNVEPDILSFAKGVTSGYLPLGGIMITAAIKQALDATPVTDRWMHAYTNSGHPTCCAVALKTLDIMEREGLCAHASAMGDRLFAGLTAAFGDHPNAGEIRGGKGLLAAVEFVEHRETKRNFPSELRFAAKLRIELMKRGVITRTRPSTGLHPATGDILFFAPPLIVTEQDVDRLIDMADEAVRSVLHSWP